MKQIKKFFILLLLIAMAFSFGSCGTTSDTDTSYLEASSSAETDFYDSDDTYDSDATTDNTDSANTDADNSYFGNTETAEETAISESGTYTAKEDVAEYLHTFGHLPANFITKKEAQALGWEGGSLEPYAPGKCIGGNYFGNYEEQLPTGKTYHECDINTLGAEKRGAERLVYADDGCIYYTANHYETFTQLY